MSEHRTSTGNPTIDELDKKIICALQGDFPLVAEPYKAMAEQIGVSEELFLARVKAMADSKKIRKMGAVLRHREVGFSSNVLVAWQVEPERLDEVALHAARPSAPYGELAEVGVPRVHRVLYRHRVRERLRDRPRHPRHEFVTVRRDVLGQRAVH